VLTYNVLLPNSKDGWWIYKYYREPGKYSEWPARQALLQKQILGTGADVVCLQEVSDLSFDTDFQFMIDAGYSSLMHEKGRLRPATFWRTDRWEKVSALQKDRSLIVALRRLGGAAGGKVVFSINVHLSAGQNADRRLRQAHEALEAVAKECKKLGLDPTSVPVVFGGDFNSQGRSAVRELLISGQVNPDFRESGDPTERGQEDRPVTSKVRKHSLPLFADASVLAFGNSPPPATILASSIDSKMLQEDGSLTLAMEVALKEAFGRCCSDGKVMARAEVEQVLLKTNKELGRGSEYRFAMAVFERRGEGVMDLEDFIALYRAELHEGKFWGVEHDLRALGGSGMAVPADGPCELRFDYIYFTTANLQLVGVQEPLTSTQRARIWGEPWEVLPNEWHPSDHLPVTAIFML
jgi:endonuclease/exonuclease/phosphatase family metal-dependent hydrolase